jgi:subtilisin-like proprotein convertase family protein
MMTLNFNPMTHKYIHYKSLLKLFLIGILLILGMKRGEAQVTLLSENFESASTQIITTTSGYNNWRLYINTDGESYWYTGHTSYASCVISGNYSLVVVSDDWFCNYALSGGYAYASNKIAYKTFSTTGYSSLTLNFKYTAGGEAGYDYGKVCYSTNGTTWTDLATTYQGRSTATSVSVSLPSTLNNLGTVYIGFRWRNDNSYVDMYTKGFVVDDIVVQGTASCSGTPSAPVATAATNVGPNSFTANWNASTGANAYYLDVSTVSNFASLLTNYNNRSVGNVTSFSVTGLSTNTDYYYRVRAKCTGTSSSSSTISLTTTLNYCSAATLVNAAYGITAVTFNTINNTTGVTGGYVDYTSLSTSVSPSVAYNLTVKVNTGGNYQFYQKAWIDWNQDGTFNTTTEEYALGSATNVTNGTSSLCPLSITVPATAVLGTTRMRVISRFSTYAISCQSGNNGEVEDYTITVSNPPGKSYGIYAPGATTGIADCEIYAQGGAGTAGCLVCNPTDAGYTNVSISDYPVITATNISCTNTTITLATAASSADWTGSSTPLTGTGASKSFTYSTTGRKNVTLYAAAACPALTATTASPSAAITDGGCSSVTGASSTITVADYGSCKINTANMTVRINVTHTNVGDLKIYLKAPNNKVLCVSTGNGGVGDNYTNTVFSDAGGTNITGGTAPFTGTYRPEGATGASSCGTPSSGVTTFATLGGSSYNPSGNWTLYVYDDAAGTSGTFVNWTLTLPAATGGGTSTSTYTGFTNMMMAPPSAGSVKGTLNGCPGTYAYSSTAAGTPGFTYAWSVLPSAGTSIASATSGSTNITFPSSSATYTVTCSQTSECCGPLTAITYTTVISAPPVAATASAASGTPCVGSSTVLTATAPANASFAWYTAATGGTLLGSGSTYTTPAATLGATTYYVEALNAAGCASGTRTPVVVTGTATTPPTASGVTRCGSGSATIEISSAVAGYTYTWYSGSCGGTLLQSNTGTSYTGTVSATTTYYVSATAPGCSASSCTAVIVTVNNLSATLTWTGSVGGANNWFNTANWGGCLPTCASDVSIPNTANQPDIGYNATAGAACKNITVNSGATLSFSDSKGELTVCGNFTHSGTFTSNSKGIVIFNGTAAQTYTRTGSGELNNVILNNTAGTATLTLANDLTLGTGGSFTFESGKVITGANNLIIKNTEASSLSGHNSSRFVQGNLRRYINTGVPTSYDFPVGHSTKGYQLANVNFTTAPSTITYLTANFNTYAVLPSALNLSECMATYNQSALNNGYWDIAANNTQNNVGSYNMTLYNTNYSNAYSGFTIMSQHNGSSTWALVNGDGSAGTCVISPVTAVERRNMKGFSKFGVAQSLSVLPIELLSFDAVYNGVSTDVNWATASETNNDHFIIERSTDAQEFSVLGKVPSKAKGGKSTSTLNYTLNDPNVKKGTYYYRLKQVDFDGKLTLSSVAMVVVDDKEALTVIPNPTDNVAEIAYESHALGFALLKVYDTRGRLVLAKELVCSKGHNTYSLDLQKEMSGMFYIVLSVGEKVYNTKLLKQ